MSDRATPPTLLVGISNPATAEQLMRLAAAVADEVGAEVLLTHVVTVASQISLTTGRSSPEVVRARDFVQEVIETARASGVSARGLVEVARSVEDGLLAAAESHGAGTILVGYSEEDAGGAGGSGAEGRFDRTMHRVARKAHANVLVAKLRRASHGRIAVPVSLGAPLGPARALCAALGRGGAHRVRFVHVAAPDADLAEVRDTLTERLEGAGLRDLGPLEVVTADETLEGLVSAVADDDLVILTPSHRPGLLDRVYSSQAEKIAERVQGSAILAWGSEEAA